MNERRKIIALNVDNLTYQDALKITLDLAVQRRPSYICFANVHMVIEAYHSSRFKEKVNNATLVLPDGMPLVQSFSFLFGVKQERIAGMDFMPDVIGAALQKKLKVFFFGSTNEVLEAIRKEIEKKYPMLDVVGFFSPPFDAPLNQDEYVNTINQSGAHIVFVALGCPKQETWMADNFSKINATLLGVGGAFPIFAGLTQRAPLVMRKLSLEWVFRLYQEPKRLFVRYLSTNSMFILLILREKLNRMANR